MLGLAGAGAAVGVLDHLIDVDGPGLGGGQAGALEVHMLGIEGQAAGDLADAGQWGLVRPDRVLDDLGVAMDRVVAGLALVGAVGDLVGLLQEVHGHVRAREIAHRGVVGFLEHQDIAAVGDLVPLEKHLHSSVLARTGDGVVLRRIGHGESPA